MGILELSGTALVVSLFSNLLKKMVARWGSMAVQIGVLVLTLVAAWLWTFYGQAFDWTWVIVVFTTAIAWYEVIIKRFWTGK